MCISCVCILFLYNTYTYIYICTYMSMSYGRNYLFGENAITKCGESPIGSAALEYGLWRIGLGGPLSITKVPCTASKFKATSSYAVHPLILSATHMYIMTSIMLVNGYVMHINIYISNRFTT